MLAMWLIFTYCHSLKTQLKCDSKETKSEVFQPTLQKNLNNMDSFLFCFLKIFWQMYKMKWT